MKQVYVPIDAVEKLRTVKKSSDSTCPYERLSSLNEDEFRTDGISNIKTATRSSLWRYSILVPTDTLQTRQERVISEFISTKLVFDVSHTLHESISEEKIQPSENHHSLLLKKR
ncbi:hypothetical protein DPMN_157632 [Dreissena polymorpha]|uniref:Uncharacterized protein n=1 Tax=Dreissena polymorpha TaxID=45954 RepID=A0A9D4IMG0_DREPO|nr:hypothetical protein DPMN_157632 [Dreissena polymorpha]